MRHPVVSIIIPCYNAVRYLAETLDSVLAQTFGDFELIIINDGSTDDSDAIVEAYRLHFGERLTYESGPNRGIGAARNRGTALAAGSYFQYLDADDLLRPHALRAKVESLESSGDDIAYSDWQELKETLPGQFVADRVHTRRIEEVHPLPEVAIIMDFWAPPVTMLYRREIVERTGKWQEDMPFCTDGRFLFEAVSCGGRLRHVPGIGADYRVTRGSNSKRDPAAFMREWAKDAFHVEELWRREGELTEARKSALLCRLGKTTSHLYELDRPFFWEVYRRMQELEPGHIPDISGKVRLVSQLLGYPRAEALALFGRRLSRLLAGTSAR